MNTFHILYDMDSVLTNFEKEYKKRFDDLFNGTQVYPDVHTREKWFVADNFSFSLKEKVQSIVFQPNFFLSLEPKEHAIEEILWAIEEGYKVSICTSPVWCSDARLVAKCIEEKVVWFSSYFNPYHTLFHPDSKIQIVFAHDKSVMCGDILIDDRPYIAASDACTWRHLLFDEGFKYAKECLQERITWETHREIVTKHANAWKKKQQSRR